MRHWVIFFAALTIFAMGASAQPKFGDWVIGDSFTQNGSLFYLDPSKTAPAPLTTLVKAGKQGRVNSVSMHPNNRDLLVGFSALKRLAVVDPSGVVVTLGPIPAFAVGHVKAEDGSVLVVSGGNIHRVDLTTKAVTSFNKGTLPPLLTDITIDRRTGDIVAVGYKALVAIDAKTGVNKRTITTAVPSPYRIAHDPVSDDFFVTEGPRSAWNRVSRAGNVAWTKLSIGAGGLKTIEQKGLILQGSFNQVAVMNKQGGVVGKMVHAYPRTTSYKFDSVEVYGSSHLNGAGSLKAGSTYSLNVSFPQVAGGRYQVVGSLAGHTPGLKLPNGDIVSLVPDALFFWMLKSGSVAGLFDNFAGTLSIYGRPSGAAPAVKIPSGLPSGLRLYLQAFVVNPSLPGGIGLSNTWAFTTR